MHWQENFHQDSNSVVINPYFSADTSYVVQAILLNNLGTALNDVTTDIEGNTRDSNNPDMGAYEFGGSPNTSPTADAGPDQIVFNKVTLDGSGSSDPDGSIVTYQWQLNHRTNPAFNRTAMGIKPTVSNLKKGYYDVTLTVTDDQGATDTDTMELAVAGSRVVVVPLY